MIHYVCDGCGKADNYSKFSEIVLSYINRTPSNLEKEAPLVFGLLCKGCEIALIDKTKEFLSFGSKTEVITKGK